MLGRTDNTVGSDQKSSIGDVDQLKGDLAGRSVTGGISILASEIGCNVFRLAGMIIMARLLIPEHFGLVGMVTTITAFAELWKDFGLGMVTIQRAEITHWQVSTLFWINTVIGVLLMLALAGAAPLISWFYNDTRLVWISIAIASTFLFGGLTIQHQALLRREMRFTQLATIQVLSTGLSTLLAIGLAWKGFEYWALVWKEVSRAGIQACGVWGFSRWIPGGPRRGIGVRTLFYTGSHLTGFNIFVFASRSLDQVLLGKSWGAESVGLYRQAWLLLMLPGSLISFPITYVLTPALSALQRDPERYQRYYLRVVSFLAFGYMPVIAYLGVYSDGLISFLFGAKWLACAPVLQILALASLVDPIVNTCGIVMITNGRTKDYFYLGVAQAFMLCLAVFIGVRWGLLGIASAYVGYTLLTLPFLVWFSFKDTPISPSRVWQALWSPALATGVMSIILVWVRYALEVHTALLEILYSALLAPFLYLSVWLMLPGGREKLVEYFSHLRLGLNDVMSRLGLSASSAATTS